VRGRDAAACLLGDAELRSARYRALLKFARNTRGAPRVVAEVDTLARLTGDESTTAHQAEASAKESRDLSRR